jgi:hypothetical protein
MAPRDVLGRRAHIVERAAADGGHAAGGSPWPTPSARRRVPSGAGGRSTRSEGCWPRVGPARASLPQPVQTQRGPPRGGRPGCMRPRHRPGRTHGHRSLQARHARGADGGRWRMRGAAACAPQLRQNLWRRVLLTGRFGVHALLSHSPCIAQPSSRSASALCGRDAEQRSFRSQKILVGIPGSSIEARQAQSQGGMTMGTAIRTLCTGCPAPCTYRSACESFPDQPRTTGHDGVMAGRSGSGSASGAVSRV